MPPPGMRSPTSAKQRNNAHRAKLKPKTANKASGMSEDNKALLPVPATSFPINRLPTELQHMIWFYVLKGPSCHHFKVVKREGNADPNEWVVFISEKRSRDDASAYRRWKELHKIRSLSFETAFRRYTAQIQRIPLLSTAPPKYKATAAIDAPNDLVIFDFGRGSTSPLFAWFEHFGYGPQGAMKINIIRSRLQHFRKVAIRWSDKHADAANGGPFMCYCAPGAEAAFCSEMKACPLELACFLDCFPNLEEFYIVPEVRLKAEKVFASNYKELVSKQKFEGLLREKTQKACPNMAQNYDLARFFDTKTEYLQQAPPAYLPPELLMESPFVGKDSPRSCVVKASRHFKNKDGSEEFHTSLQRRQQVKFGVLIPYELDPKKLAT